MRLPKSTGYEREPPRRDEGGFLGLLADGRTVGLMEAVRDGPLDRAELEERLGYGGKALGVRLSRLERMGLLALRPLVHDGRRRQWLLTAGGRELLEVRAELALTLGALSAQAEDHRALLAKSFADPWDRAIVRVLVAGPRSFSGLLGVLSGLAHAGMRAQPRQLSSSALSLRLRRLERLGLVGREPASRRGVALYAPGERAWGLGRVSARAALWRWRWTPEWAPPMAGDLLGLVRLVAEHVRVAADAGEGLVVLHVRPPEGMDGWTDVPIALAGRHISVLHAPLGRPMARVQAFPDVWCETLLSGDFEALEIEGDAWLARALLVGLADALRL